VPRSAANFGRWLERLGFKLQAQPEFHQTVQPVALIADYSQLVSPALDACGLVGGTHPGAGGEESTFLFVSSVPVWVDLLLQAGAVVGIFYAYTGLNGVPKPVMIGPTVCPPQLFAPGNGSKLVVSHGGVAPGTFDNEMPVWRTPANNSPVPLKRFFVPAGGWLAVASAATAVTVEMIAWFYESPNENAQ
jgi:hypothetical protein